MSFWIRLESFFRLFCFLSKFSKFFSTRMSHQQLMYSTQMTNGKVRSDPEWQLYPEERSRGSIKNQSINLDSHFLAVEREGKTCGRPVPVTSGRREDTSGETARDSTPANRDRHSADAAGKKDRTRDRSRPVHEAIELFDKPNDIETSLPRYQNKVARVNVVVVPEAEQRRKNTLPDKMEKLREHLEEKLAARLQKCKSERNFCPVRRADESKTAGMTKATEEDNKKKTYSNTDCTVRSEPATKLWRSEKAEVVEKARAEWSDRKSEKEKHNCLLKVNLSNLSTGDAPTAEVESLSVTQLVDEKKCFKPLAEIKRKEEKTANSEYGGGWDCHRCGQRVYHAERMLACGNAYHKTCFSCVNCRKLLGPRTYLEAEMEIYCSQCHAKKFGLTGYGYGLGPGVLQTSP